MLLLTVLKKIIKFKTLYPLGDCAPDFPTYLTDKVDELQESIRKREHVDSMGMVVYEREG